MCTAEWLVASIDVEGKNPAGLVLDPASPKLYVVMGDTSQVVVIDREKRSVIASWPITGGPEPHAVALDAPNHRLFIGSRVKRSHVYKPGKLVVMDADNGKVIDALDTEGGVDEVEWEAKSRRIYYTGTTGFIEVFSNLTPIIIRVWKSRHGCARQDFAVGPGAQPLLLGRS